MTEEAYTDRNQLALAFLKTLQDKDIETGYYNDPDTSEEWRVVYAELPQGQISYHVPTELIEEYDFLEEKEECWDGHTTEEKRDRLEEFIQNH